jgi:hypothetical protein
MATEAQKPEATSRLRRELLEECAGVGELWDWSHENHTAMIS